jgi:hypothetical protein
MRSQKTLTRVAIGAACAAALVVWAAAGAAWADSDSCREWKREHCRWKAEAMRLYLRGAPQQELDQSVFEMLQREAYLSSCEESAQASRAAMVGWRLVGRTADEYGGAVLEAVLERSGFDMDLRAGLAGDLGPLPRRGAGVVAQGLRVSDRRSQASRYAESGDAGAAR